MPCLGINLLRRQGRRERQFCRKVVLAKVHWGSNNVDNSSNTKLAQHLNNVRPRFERYGNIRW